MFKFELGQEVKDKVNGFKGVITARVEYLNGCLQYCVEPTKLTKTGEIVKPPYIDESQLTKTGKGISIEQKRTGGRMENSPSASYKG